VDMHGAEKRRFGPLDYHKNKIGTCLSARSIRN
jgi:hypothetical protein